jgi:hypothetical protein
VRLVDAGRQRLLEVLAQDQGCNPLGSPPYGLTGYAYRSCDADGSTGGFAELARVEVSWGREFELSRVVLWEDLKPGSQYS